MTGFEFSYTLMWTILAIVFTIAEGMTMGLTTIWFAFGALAALIAAALKLNIVIQVIVFLLVSVLTLVYTRPIATKVLKIGSTKTNVSSLIGEKGVVTKAIEAFNTGQVKVKGQVWTAKGETLETAIAVGEEIVVTHIEGVKLIVKLCDAIEPKGGNE